MQVNSCATMRRSISFDAVSRFGAIASISSRNIMHGACSYKQIISKLWSWTQNVTNEQVLICAKETRNILKMIWHRKHTCRRLWHFLRHENFLHVIIEGKMMGKATQDRKRTKLLHDIMEGWDYGQLNDLVSERSRWKTARVKACQKPA